MKEINIHAFQCEKCDKLYYTQESAESCCKTNNCKHCGKETPKFIYACEECLSKRKFEGAIKYTYEEYIKEFLNHMIVYGDNYYKCIEELLEDINCRGIEVPEYVYGTDEIIIEIDIKNIISDIEDDSGVEDFEFNNTKELIDFVNEWNKKNSQKVYSENTNIIVYIQKKEN